MLTVSRRIPSAFSHIASLSPDHDATEARDCLLNHDSCPIKELEFTLNYIALCLIFFLFHSVLITFLFSLFFHVHKHYHQCACAAHSWRLTGCLEPLLSHIYLCKNKKTRTLATSNIPIKHYSSYSVLLKIIQNSLFLILVHNRLQDVELYHSTWMVIFCSHPL